MIKNHLSAFAGVVAKSQGTLVCHYFLPSTFRLLTFGLLLTFNFSFLISNCGLDVEDPTLPSPPVWVQKSLPEEWPEHGIDANESDQIFLEWEEVAEDIKAYYLYRATWYDALDSLGEYYLLSSLEAKSLSKFEFRDQFATIRIRYYYKLKSEDMSENMSEFSASISYMLLPPVSSSSMSPNGLSMGLETNRNLYWYYDHHHAEMENFILTIISLENELIARVLVQPANYTGGWEEWQIPSNISLVRGAYYKWRVDAIARINEGLESSGSESVWAVFIYDG